MKNLILSTSSMSGRGIVNKKRENLGRLHSMIIDLESGMVLYAILRFENQWWAKDNYYAVPLKALKFDATDDSRILLDADSEKLRDAPCFEIDSLPLEPTNEFIHAVYTHYGHTPYAIFEQR